MCLAVPAQVIAIDKDQMATVEVSGVKRLVALDMVPETQVGDYVVVHVGFALQRLDEKEARQTLALFEAMNEED